MTLGELIHELEKLPPDLIFKDGFSTPHSWRGVYAELAFSPAGNVTAFSMLKNAQSAVGRTYEGWKGGNYTMNLDTACHIAAPGDYNGDEDALTVWRWKFMLSQAEATS